MTISAPDRQHGSDRMPPTRRDAAPAAASATSAESFARVLGGLNGKGGARGGVELLLPVPESDFAALAGNTVRIGDDAVRFDARPIVGPSGPLPAPAHSVEPATSDVPTVPVDSLPADGTEASIPRILQAPLAGSQPTGLAVGTMPATAPPAQARLHLHLPRQFAAAAPAPLPAPTAHRPARISIDFPRANAGEALSPRPLRHAALTPDPSVLFARLVAVDGTYRIRTRGAVLTPDEADTLAGRIRAALREYGLADRPVTFLTTGGAG